MSGADVTEQKKKILLVEDEPHLAFNLQLNLQAEGYDVVLATDGQTAVDLFKSESPFDLIILDAMLPELDGFAVARRIRGDDDQTHILMLTALGREEDRVRGFEAGIDDYITKPFHLQEMLLRVKRMIRRSSYFNQASEKFDDIPKATEKTENKPELIRCGPFELHTGRLELQSLTGTHSVTAMETDILREFLLHPDQVLSREYLLDRVWGMKGDIETRTVDNFIVRLRRYLEPNPSRPQYLISVRGRGYRLVVETD